MYVYMECSKVKLFHVAFRAVTALSPALPALLRPLLALLYLSRPACPYPPVLQVRLTFSLRLGLFGVEEDGVATVRSEGFGVLCSVKELDGLIG